MKTKKTEDLATGRRGECQAAKDFGRSANQALQHNDYVRHASCEARGAPATVVADL